MSTVPRALLLSALLTLVPVGVGVAVSDETTLEPEIPAYTATDLTDFDTSTAVVRRAAFCDALPAEAVAEALGGTAVVTAYGNGEQTPAMPGSEVSHEFGCQFTPAAAEGTALADPPAVGEARGWVFAPPVTAARAGELLAAPAAKGCAPDTGAPAYGDPSLALVCATDSDRTVTYRGLFGDAWLSCSLTLPATVPETDLLARAGRWCVAIAKAASAQS